jgi:FixH
MTQPQRAWMAWPAIVFGLLALQLVICGAAIALSSGDSTFATEPDYYAKAAQWDATRAARARADDMGWRFESSAVRLGAAGMRLVLTVRDSRGAIAAGLSVSVEAFHHAAARNRHVQPMAEQPDGSYAAEISPAKSGLWECRYSIGTGDQKTSRIERVELADGGAGS